MENNENLNVTETTETTETTNTEETKETFTQAEVDRMISKMAERFETKFSKRAEEAQKLASMNAEEKAKYEIEKTRAEIETMKKNMVIEQNKAECVKILAEENSKLASLADFAVAEDAETMKKNLDLIKQVVTQVANDMVDKRLKGYTPKRETLPNEINKETFNKMSLDQQQELYNSNPELYKQMIG